MRPTAPAPVPQPPAWVASAGMLRLPALLCVVAAAGCGGPAPVTPQGEWAGTLRTEQGRCPDARPSRLLVDGRELSFVPGGGVLILHGTLAPAGTRLHAQLLMADADRKPLPMVFEGALAADGSRIEGSYGTPACRAAVTLLRPAHDGLQRALGN